MFRVIGVLVWEEFDFLFLIKQSESAAVQYVAKNQPPQKKWRHVNSDMPPVSFWVYWGGYLATRSSHFTMPNITPMEMKQTPMNTAQATQMGQAL